MSPEKWSNRAHRREVEIEQSPLGGVTVAEEQQLRRDAEETVEIHRFGTAEVMMDPRSANKELI